MNTDNQMARLIRKRALLATCVKPVLIFKKGFHLDNFRPLALVFRSLQAQSIHQRFNNYFSMVIRPVLVSFRKKYLYSDRLYRHIVNNYDKETNREFKPSKFPIERHNFSKTVSFTENDYISNKTVHPRVTVFHSFHVHRYTGLSVVKNINSVFTEYRGNSNRILRMNSHLQSVFHSNKHKPSVFNDPDKYVGYQSIYNTFNRKFSFKKYRYPAYLQNLSGHNRPRSRLFAPLTKKEEEFNAGKYCDPASTRKSPPYKVSGNNKHFLETGEELYFSHQPRFTTNQSKGQVDSDITQTVNKRLVETNIIQPENKNKPLNAPTKQSMVSDPGKLIDIDRLAQTVMQKIDKNIRIERERRGLL